MLRFIFERVDAFLVIRDLQRKCVEHSPNTEAVLLQISKRTNADWCYQNVNPYYKASDQHFFDEDSKLKNNRSVLDGS